MTHVSLSSTQRGLTLVELMIGMLLGLLVVGAAVSVLGTNNQTLRATRSLGGLQDASQTAFEIMARDIREAGGNVCSRRLPVANVVNGGASQWFLSSPGVEGWPGSATSVPGLTTGTATGNRVAGTEAIRTISMVGSALTIESHNPTSAQFKINRTNHGLNDGDILMVCDWRQAAILQVTNSSQTNATVVHNTGTGSPGNCTKGLGLPVVCTANGTAYTYGANSRVGKLASSIWYVGRNSRGGSSLFLATLRTTGGTPGIVNEEIAEGVTAMALTYLQNGAYRTADAVTDWSQVSAVRLQFTLRGGQSGDAGDRIGTDGQVLTRTASHTITLRNRNA